MDSLRRATIAYAATRIAYGVGLAVAPRVFGGPWLGDSLRSGGTQVAARGLGIRDAGLAAGVAAGAAGAWDPRPWLVGCAVGDATDLVGTLMVADELPDRARWGTVAAAGLYGAAALGLAAALSDD